MCLLDSGMWGKGGKVKRAFLPWRKNKQQEQKGASVFCSIYRCLLLLFVVGAVLSSMQRWLRWMDGTDEGSK